MGDPRGPLFRVIGGGFLLISLCIGLLFYGEPADVPARETMQARTFGGVPASPRSSASLSVGTDIAGATVFVDGDSIGTAPVVIGDVAEGERRVEIIGLEGTIVADTVVWVERHGTVDLDLETESGGREPSSLPLAVQSTSADLPSMETSLGGIRITSDPSGASVSLDGRRLGVTPLSVGGVSPGRYAVSVERPGYETAVQFATVRPNGTYEAAIGLRATGATVESPPRSPEPTRTGTLEVLVRPWGSITIDGETRHEGTDVIYRAEFDAGSHQVVVSNPELGSDRGTVTVEADGVTRIEFDLSDGRQ